MSLDSSSDGHQSTMGGAAVDPTEPFVFSLFLDALCNLISYSPHLASTHNAWGIRPDICLSAMKLAAVLRLTPIGPSNEARLAPMRIQNHLQVPNESRVLEPSYRSFVVHNKAPFANPLPEGSSRFVQAR